MDYSPSCLQLPRKLWMERLQAFFEVLLVSGLASTFLAALIFSSLHGKNVDLMETSAQTVCFFLLLESGIEFLILAIILKAHRESLAGLGLRRIRWKPNLLIGLGLAPLLLPLNWIVAYVFRTFLPDYYLEHNPLTGMIHTPWQLILFIVAALVAGGIKEEVQRAFILRRFDRYLGGAGAGLLLWSLAFGAGHYVQGAQGITLATLYGFFFGILYLVRGSLIAPMAAHAAYDTLALLIYWFWVK